MWAESEVDAKEDSPLSLCEDLGFISLLTATKL
jgi:hypothetical protein